MKVIISISTPYILLVCNYQNTKQKSIRQCGYIISCKKSEGKYIQVWFIQKLPVWLFFGKSFSLTPVTLRCLLCLQFTLLEGIVPKGKVEGAFSPKHCPSDQGRSPFS